MIRKKRKKWENRNKKRHLEQKCYELGAFHSLAFAFEGTFTTWDSISYWLIEYHYFHQRRDSSYWSSIISSYAFRLEISPKGNIFTYESINNFTRFNLRHFFLASAQVALAPISLSALLSTCFANEEKHDSENVHMGCVNLL